MGSASELMSPRQVARALGVSESSLKRWCDRGLIEAVRTAGGHRKLMVSDVINFVRKNDHALVSPEVLRLPSITEKSRLGLDDAQSRLTDALLVGDVFLAKQIVLDLYLDKHSLATIFDDVVAEAFVEIGRRWECKTADVYQERRACTIIMRALDEIRRLQKPSHGTWSAIGGTLEPDRYILPTTMSELVLAGLGFSAQSLGVGIPASSMAKAIREIRPHLYWLSLSHIPDANACLGDVSTLANACSDAGAVLVVGGRAITADIRQRLECATVCDNMRQLESFAKSMQRLANRQTKPHSSGRKRRRTSSTKNPST